jgi:hypothetical protein
MTKFNLPSLPGKVFKIVETCMQFARGETVKDSQENINSYISSVNGTFQTTFKQLTREPRKGVSFTSDIDDNLIQLHIFLQQYPGYGAYFGNVC